MKFHAEKFAAFTHRAELRREADRYIELEIPYVRCIIEDRNS